MATPKSVPGDNTYLLTRMSSDEEKKFRIQRKTPSWFGRLTYWLGIVFFVLLAAILIFELLNGGFSINFVQDPNPAQTIWSFLWQFAQNK